MKEENFRIKCTCDNAFQMDEGHQQSVGDFLETKGSNHVDAICRIIMEHYESEHKDEAIR